MRLIFSLFIFSLFFAVSTSANAQEEKEVPIQKEGEKVNPFQEGREQGQKPRLDPRKFNKPPGGNKPNQKDLESSRKKQTQNNKNKKRGGSGKKLVVEKVKNTKKKYEFKTGDRVVVFTKDEERFRGKIGSISPKEIVVADSTIEIKKLSKIRRGFLPVLKKRASGTGLFIGGAAVTTGGIYLGYLSTLVFSSGGPFIIVTAAGITAMLGIDIVGVSISAEGTKLVIERTRFDVEDKWKASVN